MADHKKVLEHVKSHEGGYSADPVDNASSDPSPIIGLDKRYPSLPVHTYRGVTWRTWKNYSAKKGMAVSADKFVGMSLATWEDLLKTLYWDSILGDQIKSQGAAEMIFEAVWGGGATRFYVVSTKTRIRHKSGRSDRPEDRGSLERIHQKQEKRGRPYFAHGEQAPRVSSGA